MSTITADNDASLVTYLRKVYTLLTTAVLVTALTAWATVSLGHMTSVPIGKYTMEASPLVVLGLEHPLVLGLTFLGFGLAAVVVRKSGAFGLGTLYAFAAVSGVFIGPVIAVATFLGHHGAISSNPVRDAALLTLGAFITLSTYTIASRTNFNYLGGFLFTGLILLILAGCLNLFFGSVVVDLALASVGVLVFVGYVLYDTSEMVHGDRSDPGAAALSLYLDVLNLFINLLRLLMSGFKKD